MGKIIWTERALYDLQSIYDYIALDSPKNAQNVGLKIVKRVEILTSFPKSGRMVPEFDREDIRELIQWSFRIVYRIVDTNEIWILRVHHASRPIT